MDFSNESSNLAKSPAVDEFEISIFGPGIGECILMHLGNGEWFVIDSCRLPGSKSSAALEYLDALGIEPASAIKRILAPHWHDDHVKGMSEIVRRCPNALFAMSAALESDQFNQLVFEIEEHNKLVAATSTASEFAEILEEVERRGKQPPTAVSDGFLIFAAASRVWSKCGYLVRLRQQFVMHKIILSIDCKQALQSASSSDLSQTTYLSRFKFPLEHETYF